MNVKALRIKIRQNQASYAKEETVNNRMTYPLPPFSTIIGALHAACGYKTYHQMDISVQGKFDSMQKEIYTHNALLNNLCDDRGILIWLQNPDSLSGGYIKVAEALKKTGNSFKDKKTIRIDDAALLEQYINLSQDKERGSKKELAHYKTLTKGCQYQEVLYGVELVIHVQSDEATLQDILNHVNDFTCLGRSEDFVDIEEMVPVDLIKADNIDEDEIEEYRLTKNHSMYINADRVDGEQYYIGKFQSKIEAKGTVYYLSKNYTVKAKKRIFNRIPCFYTSEVTINSEKNDNLFVDPEGGYIVDFN